jgi:hypothetical protein
MRCSRLAEGPGHSKVEGNFNLLLLQYVRLIAVALVVTTGLHRCKSSSARSLVVWCGVSKIWVGSGLQAMRVKQVARGLCRMTKHVKERYKEILLMKVCQVDFEYM